MNLASSSQTNLYGLNQYFNELKNLYFQDKFPNKILLSGEKGIGKCTMAYHFINYILSLDEEYSYDLKNFKIISKNKSFKLVQNKSNPNFNLIDVIEDKKNIDINQIRNLILSLNKSSFNSKPRFVLIDNIELLNINSINALLKILEEPNDNINFLLINNNKKILSTLKSRCLNFKINISYNQSIEIISKILNENIFNLLSNELINYYSTPGQLFKIISFAKDINIDLKKTNLKQFIYLIINDRNFKKQTSIKDLIYPLIEIYFRKNISVDNIKLINFHNYFLKKIDNVNRFNLDNESVLMEFEDKVLNG